MTTNKPAHEYFAPVEAYRSEKNLKTLSQQRREAEFEKQYEELLEKFFGKRNKPSGEEV